MLPENYVAFYTGITHVADKFPDAVIILQYRNTVILLTYNNNFVNKLHKFGKLYELNLPTFKDICVQVSSTFSLECMRNPDLCIYKRKTKRPSVLSDQRLVVHCLVKHNALNSKLLGRFYTCIGGTLPNQKIRRHGRNVFFATRLVSFRGHFHCCIPAESTHAFSFHLSRTKKRQPLKWKKRKRIKRRK